jgi:hypothetical protein
MSGNAALGACDRHAGHASLELEIEMHHEGVEMTGEPWNPEAARNPDEDPSGTEQPTDRRDTPAIGDDADEVPIDDQPAAELPAAESDQGRHGQFDGASGGYGSHSGISSSGTGDGEPGMGGMDDGTSSGATGATSEGPTAWVREAPGTTDS